MTTDPFTQRFGPGLVLKYDDESLARTTEELRRHLHRLTLERDYIRLFDQYLQLRRELRELDH